jgi:hypothetical protein
MAYSASAVRSNTSWALLSLKLLNDDDVTECEQRRHDHPQTTGAPPWLIAISRIITYATTDVVGYASDIIEK